jgi:hypothetical protein
MAKTWMQSLQDTYSFNPVGSHGTVTVGTAGTAIVVPAGAQSLLIQAFTQNARLVFAATGSGTATGFRVTAAYDEKGYQIGENVGTIHVTGESDSASVQYQFFGRSE